MKQKAKSGSIELLYKYIPATMKLINMFDENWQIVRTAIACVMTSALLSPGRVVVGLFGRSGYGKTTIQRAVINFVSKYKRVYDTGKGGFTLAGLSRAFGSSDPEVLAKVEMFSKSNIIYIEDLSDLSGYVLGSVLSLLCDFAESHVIDYTTVDSQRRIEIETLKSALIGGTEAHYQRLISHEAWNSKLRRRTLPLFLFYMPKEYKKYVEASKVKSLDIDDAINYYGKMFDGIELDNLDAVSKINPLDKTRLSLIETIQTSLEEPMSSSLMADKIAKGHAIFNGRNYTLPLDYIILDGLLSRIMLPFKSADEIILFDDIMTKGKLLTIDEAIKDTDMSRYRITKILKRSKIISATKKAGKIVIGIKIADRLKKFNDTIKTLRGENDENNT